jgi:hypothetical protein
MRPLRVGGSTKPVSGSITFPSFSALVVFTPDSRKTRRGKQERGDRPRKEREPGEEPATVTGAVSRRASVPPVDPQARRRDESTRSCLGALHEDMGDSDAFAASERLMARRDRKNIDPVTLRVADELKEAGALNRDVDEPERHFDDLICSFDSLPFVPHQYFVDVAVNQRQSSVSHIPPRSCLGAYSGPKTTRGTLSQTFCIIRPIRFHHIVCRGFLAFGLPRAVFRARVLAHEFQCGHPLAGDADGFAQLVAIAGKDGNLLPSARRGDVE